MASNDYSYSVAGESNKAVCGVAGQLENIGLTAPMVDEGREKEKEKEMGKKMKKKKRDIVAPP